MKRMKRSHRDKSDMDTYLRLSTDYYLYSNVNDEKCDMCDNRDKITFAKVIKDGERLTLCYDCLKAIEDSLDRNRN